MTALDIVLVHMVDHGSHAAPGVGIVYRNTALLQINKYICPKSTEGWLTKGTLAPRTLRPIPGEYSLPMHLSNQPKNHSCSSQESCASRSSLGVPFTFLSPCLCRELRGCSNPRPHRPVKSRNPPNLEDHGVAMDVYYSLSCKQIRFAVHLQPQSIDMGEAISVRRL